MERKRHPGLLFDANRTPEGCGDNLGSSAPGEPGEGPKLTEVRSLIRPFIPANLDYGLVSRAKIVLQ